MITVFLTFCLAATCSFAQPVAVITGPATAPAGELVVLSSASSTGDNFLWVIPEDKAQSVPRCTTTESKVFFATAVPGTYQFILVVADKEAKMSYAIHHVTISSTVGPDPKPEDPKPEDPKPEDPKPEDPNPKPELGFGRYENLYQTSKMNSEQMADPATRSALHQELEKTTAQLKVRCDSNNCPPLAEARAMITSTIERVLLQRKGESEDAPWASGWRVANNQWLAQVNITTTPEYVKAMMALTAGLK